MPAMTNPEGYAYEFYDPKHPTRRGIMGHSLDFHHIIPEDEESSHLKNRCCECEPYIDPDDITVMYHNIIGVSPCSL